MKKLLLNPFEKNPETRLFIFGLAVTAIGSYLAYIFNGRYDGVIDLHFTNNINQVVNKKCDTCSAIY